MHYVDARMYGMVCMVEKEERDGGHDSLHHRPSLLFNQHEEEERKKGVDITFLAFPPSSS